MKHMIKIVDFNSFTTFFNLFFDWNQRWMVHSKEKQEKYEKVVLEHNALIFVFF